MAIWQATDGSLHDDMNGEALSLPIWPKGMTPLTDDQVSSILAANTAAQAVAAANEPPSLQQQIADLQAQLAAIANTNPTMAAAMAAVKV